MSNFTDYYYKMKNGTNIEIKKPSSPSDIIKIISKRWRLTIPKTNKEKNENPLFVHITSQLEKFILPIEVKTQSIVSFGRYRGFIFTVCHHPIYTDGKYNIILFVKNSMKGNLTLYPLSNEEKQEICSDNELLNHYQINATALPDRQTLFKYIDSYTQQILVDKANNFNKEDKFLFNKNAIVITLSNETSEDLVDTVMSILYNILETIQKIG